ncbi:MAG: hypothetical protein OK422_00640 [Thaumarchaeota archaeon]|nr:hypothetical protein [Nitrososphaerota archaeon]
MEEVKGLVELKACPHGTGVFFLQDHAKGERLLSFHTTLVRATASNGYALRLDESLFWDEEPQGSPFRWTNFIDHDPVPNVRFEFSPKGLGPVEASLYVEKEIHAGEEMFINYKAYYPSNPVEYRATGQQD